MIPNDDKISSLQLGVFIFNTILGVGILTLPSSLTKATENDAWILCIVAGLVNIIFIYFMCRVGVKYRDLGFVGTLKKLFGGIIGTILALPVLAYFVIFSSIETRIFAETTKLYLLQNTPIEFIIIPILILSIILARVGIEPTARFFEFVSPIIILVVVILLLVALPESDFSNLRPFFANSPLKYIEGISTGAFAYGGFEILLVMFPFLRRPKQAFRFSVSALLVIIAMYTGIVIECIARLGSKETQSLLYPTMTMIQASEVPGGFVERLEGLLLSLWVLFVFTTIVATLIVASIIIGDLLKQKKRSHAVDIVLPIVYIIALVPQSIVELLEISDTLSIYLGYFTLIALPFTMFVLSLIRGKGAAKDEG